MKKVYLIRHCLPDFPQGQRLCLGTTDIPLGPEGLAQAADMARQLPPVTAVYASPLSRAVQTAQAIGQEVTVLQGLREMHAGEWEGLDFRQIRFRYPQLYAARGADPRLPLPGAEDPDYALVRFRMAMEEAAAAAPGDFAVVAHGGIIALFLEAIGAGWYKPRYGEIIPLQWNHHTFTLQEDD